MNIPLDKDEGLSPHLCTCERCGNDSEDSIVGVLRKAQDSNGQWHYCNRGESHKVNRQRMDAGLATLSYWEEVKEGERVPYGLCKSCEEELDMQRKVVQSGGIYFRCSECRNTGVIKPTPFTAEVRKTMKIEPPATCGIQFEKCVEHEG